MDVVVPVQMKIVVLLLMGVIVIACVMKAVRNGETAVRTAMNSAVI